jgi:eukaryotic-like serine/threonine-protein kinase
VQKLGENDPRRVGNYTLLHRLGQGAMGSVYLGRSQAGRPVAVKVARAELLADPSFRERFRREIGMARQVGGFWTAAVVDADPEAPRPWLATEYIPGPSLHHAVAEAGALDEPAALRLAAGLAEALAAIHKTGLVHRDLKPSNVLLHSDGPRVIDFGIAHAVQTTALTAPGEFFGTPGFLSPEQVSGAPVGPPSDVFALGAVLVFATTATGPFGEGDAAALLYRVAHSEADISGVPGTARQIAAMCLHRDPRRRPSPQELLDRLTNHAGATSTRWLPQPVRTLIDQHQTALRTALNLPAKTNDGLGRTHDECAAGETASRVAARFRTSRIHTLLRACTTALGAFVVSGLGNPLFPPGVRFVGGVATTALGIMTALLVVAAVRPQQSLDVTADGLTLSRGRRRWDSSWPTIARTRVVSGARAGLVIWLRPGSTMPHRGLCRPHHGGLRIYPIRGPRRRRAREASELRAALAWYAAHIYDPAP